MDMHISYKKKFGEHLTNAITYNYCNYYFSYYVILLFVFYHQDNCLDFESSVVAQCDAIIDAVKRRKQQLMEHIAQDKEHKIATLKEQVSHCTKVLQSTTGLLQFSIEVLKESDPVSFLQVRIWEAHSEAP